PAPTAQGQSSSEPAPPQPEREASPAPELAPAPEQKPAEATGPSKAGRAEQEHTARALTAEEIVRLQAKYQELCQARPKLKQADIIAKLCNMPAHPVSPSTIYRHIVKPSS